jgi:hypothetical protein
MESKTALHHGVRHLIQLCILAVLNRLPRRSVEQFLYPFVLLRSDDSGRSRSTETTLNFQGCGSVLW